MADEHIVRIEDPIYIQAVSSVDPLLVYLRGYSAYEVAVQAGFDGTREEWLASLAEEATLICEGYRDEAEGFRNEAQTARDELDPVLINIATLLAVGAKLTEIDTVSDNIDAILTVNNDLILGLSSKIGIVSGSIANVNLVGASIANVNSVADNIGDVNLAADNIVAIQAAPTYAEEAEKWAENPEDSPVETGKYSAKHWAAKAEDVVDEAYAVVENKIDKTAVKQETGSSTTDVMSQKAVTDEIDQLAGEVSDNEYSLNKLSLNGRLKGRAYTTTPQPTIPSYGDIYLVMSKNVWGTTSVIGQYLLYNGTEFVVKYLYELNPRRWHSKIKEGNAYNLRYEWDKILNCIWDAKVFYPDKTDTETKYMLNHFWLVSNKINFVKLTDYDPITDTYATFNLPDIPFDFTSQKGVKTVRFLLENETYCDLTIDFDSIIAERDLGDYDFSSNENSLLRDTYFTNIGYYAVSESRSYISHYIAAQNYTGTAFEQKCTGTADQIIINQHILAASQAGGGTVELSAGNFFINDSIVMHPNVTLKCNKRSVIKLVNGASKYMLTNHNYVSGTGTSNITVDGGIWNGNKSGGQPRNYTGNPIQTYWGFGFFFKEVNNLQITNMRIEQTESWGIALYRAKEAVFDNIEFRQGSSVGSNGDGITGSSWQDVLINNIYGYTNDDMIGFANSKYFGGSLGGNMIFWEDEGFDSNNVRITNLNLQKHPVSGNYPHRAVGIYPTEESVIDNLYIDGVTGGWAANAYAIGIIQYWGDAIEFNGVGYIGKVVIKNVDLESPQTQPTLVQVSNSPQIIVDDLSVDNLTLRCNTESNTSILSAGSGCKNIHAANITVINKSAGTIYPVRISETSLIPINLNLTGVDKRDGVGDILFSRNSAGMLRINSTHNVDKSIITNPKSGDRVVDLDGKPYVYYNSQWNPIF